MYQQYYQQFLNARPDVQHFACHSHHFWPDVTREAMLEYWDDTAKMVDDKWDYIFSTKLPQCQSLIADILNIKQPERVVFAPNTHELLYRIYSTFDPHKKIKILTTDSEFYSFQRQSERWQQSDLAEVTRIPTEPFATFETRFIEAAQNNDFDWIFCSHVFFNSGYAIQDLPQFVKQLPNKPLVTIDGYHGFMAVPTDLSELEQEVFYLSGSYKYSQGGEGACFLVVPDGNYQPIFTGWFAEFGDLHNRVPGQVAYAKGGQQFAGATIDMTALYRLHAVFSLFKQDDVTVTKIHKFVIACQKAFLAIVDTLEHPYLNRSNLLQCHLYESFDETKVGHNETGRVEFGDGKINKAVHGHFLTFKMPKQEVENLAKHLKDNGIMTDYRGDRLRFGFAMYHEPHQYDLSCLANQ